MPKESKRALKKFAQNFLYLGHEDNPNNLTLLDKTIGSIIVQYIQCKKSKGFSLSDEVLVTKKLMDELIDFSDAFIFNVKTTLDHKSRMLPYGAIIMTLMEAVGVDVHGEEGREVASFFGKKNLAGIKYRRKRQQQDIFDKEDAMMKGEDDGAERVAQRTVNSEVALSTKIYNLW
ncbi:hypothetical protein M9H77_09116 [Catharanthus roseus]|uniref:Uncharacterized protein n=1 Tax=Catharanthus roseus TaxID=4058 RepID=A0ACC0BZR1_CATRO|nr:hypothetical protein M9H77_09116 [Catharanthus roseus]